MFRVSCFRFSRLVFFALLYFSLHCRLSVHRALPPTFVSQPIFTLYSAVTIFIVTHTILSSSRLILSRPVSVCISLSLSCSSNSLNHDSSDLILNLNRYRQPIWIDMITDRTARGHATWKPNCVLYSPHFLLLRVSDDGREEEDRGSQCAHLALRDKLDEM